MRKHSRLISLALALCMVLALCVTAFAAEKNGDIVVLYTNDVHCAYDTNIGYAGLAAMKAELEAAGNYVALVDAGDALQGAPIGALTKGAYPQDIQKQVDYDVLVPGNHEFDYGMANFHNLVGDAKCRYYSANFMDLTTNKTVLDAYKVMTFGETSVAFVGITTPESTVEADDNGSYGFCKDESGEKLYAAVQAAVDAARTEADYVIAVGHTGSEGVTERWSSQAIIAHTNGIDAYLDGHSHETIHGTLVKNMDGKDVLLSSTGSKFASVGKLTIADGQIHTELISQYKGRDKTVDTYIKGISASFEELLGETTARSDVELTASGAESNLGDLCADACRVVLDADAALVRSGDLHGGIAKGSVTLDDIIQLQPLSNQVSVAEVTGRQLLDALEHGVRNYPEKSDSLLQVSGLVYEVNAFIPSSVVTDGKGNFEKVDGEYRVSNVMVNGRPLKPDRTYTVAALSSMLQDGSDGFSMFEGSKILKNSVMLDNEVLVRYIQDELSGKITAKYSAAQGRIVIRQTPFVDVPSDWYMEAVMYVYTKGLMKGTSDTTFRPMEPLDRAGLVTTLYRLSGSPKVKASVTEYFNDCKEDYWYSDAIVWAYENRIVDGFGSGVFKPDAPLTREQMAKILYTYAQYNGAEPLTAFYLDYKDQETISDWALPGVAYCTVEKILSGVGGGNFNAQGTANRAMVAKVLMTLDMAK